MTSTSRGPRHPSNCDIPLAAFGSVGIGVSRRPRPLLSEALASRIVSVEDPYRLLESAHALREAQFQKLVRRYLSQIQYGCDDPSCTTPTCLSCRKRDTSKPFKAPTQVTARALAHYLASQDNPHASLCRNNLKVLYLGVEVEGDRATIRTIDESHTPEGNSALGIGALLTSDASVPVSIKHDTTHSINGNPDDMSSHASVGSERSAALFWEAVDCQHQPKKDNKSLGQNLYDTVAVICSFSKQISNPLNSFRSVSNSRERLPPISETHRSRARVGAETENSKAAILGADTTSQPPEAVSVLDPQPLCNGHMGVTTSTGHVIHPPQADLQTSPSLNRRPSKKAHRRAISYANIEYHPDGRIIRKITQRMPQQRTTNYTCLDGAGWNGSAKSNTMSKSKFQNGAPINGQSFRAISGTTATEKPDVELRERAAECRKREHLALPVTSHLSCDVMEELASHTRDPRSESGDTSASSFVVDHDQRSRLHPSMPFVNRSLYYSLSDPATLLWSFREEPWKQGVDSPLPHLNPSRLSYAFRSWSKRNGSLIFDSLWIATEILFTPPPEIIAQKSPRLRAARKSPNLDGFPEPLSSPAHDKGKPYLSDLDAAHIIMICVHALTSLVPNGWPHTWAEVRNLRSWGVILPRAPAKMDNHAEYHFVHPWLDIIDELEYEPALRLADRLVRGIAARRCFSEILHTLSRQAGERQESKLPTFGLMDILTKHLTIVEAQASQSRLNLDTGRDPGWTVTSVFMEWLRTIIIKQWDCKSEVHRWSAVGGAIEIMSDFFEHRNSLNLYSNMFHIHHLHERMDQARAPSEWLKRSFNPNTLNILSYPFLFHPQRIVSFFRTLNYRSIYKQFERAERTQHLRRQLHMFYNDQLWYITERRLQVLFSRFLVLDVSRTDPLKDTFDQLWGLEKRHFLKPLKVKLGHSEGEQGLDQGGVSLELFQVILTEVLDPDNGMFSVHPTTRMTWIQPGSMEPLYRFELIGILFSMAIYNGITLPVTFPTAFYRRLLDKPVTSLSHIRDGWPDLARGFDQLLSWSDGDVGDIFARTYAFIYEAKGQAVEIDMMDPKFARDDGLKDHADGNHTTKSFPAAFTHNGPWEDDTHSRLMKHGFLSHRSIDELDGLVPDDQHEAELVTNANRERYVEDYIYFLTDRSIRSRFNAFAKGFYTCLDWKAVNLFNEDALKFLVEGYHDIDIAALRSATKYEDGYTVTHPTVRFFWDVVESFDFDDKKRLLEFVTASDRVPVGGPAKMQFTIVRSTTETDRLPTSSTCFGRLSLPEYETKEQLESKLRLALEYSRGFGAI